MKSALVGIVKTDLRYMRKIAKQTKRDAIARKVNALKGIVSVSRKNKNVDLIVDVSAVKIMIDNS